MYHSWTLKMTYDWKMQLYWRLPIVLQELAVSMRAKQLERLYFGPGYKEWRQRFHCWQSWSRAECVSWQTSRLKYLLELAATRVPYYRERWSEVRWNSIESAADIHLLPCIEKHAIRQNECRFIVEGLDLKSLLPEWTSGSTGTALCIYRSPSMYPKWWAMYEMCRNAAGVGREIPYATLQGRPVVPGYAKQPPYWRYNHRWRQLYLSSYHVSQETARGYVEAMQKYGSQWIEGYGSAIATLADSATAAGVPPIRLRAAIVSGDTLLPGMRASIESYFQCPVYDHYGQSEAVCMAMQCSRGRMHILPAAGIVEILRDDGTACGPGEVGEIVATSLLNDAMPLIRYRMGDYAAWAEDRGCPCGNVHPIIANLEGRVDDYLVTANGRKIGRLSTAMKRSPTIHSAQLVQQRPGHAFLLVRPGNGYTRRDAIAVCHDIMERIGAFEIDVSEVREIPKTPQGKTALVVRFADRPAMREAYREIIPN
jgi:phenylacetate-CoA ligase